MTDFSFLDKAEFPKVEDGKSVLAPEKPAETPVADTAVAETHVEKVADAPTEADKPTEQSSFDFSKVLGGRFKSEEELSTVVTEYETYKTEVENLKNKVSEYSDYIKPSSDLVKKLNEIQSKGGDVNLFLALQPLDTSKLSDVEAEKIRLMYEEGFKPHEADREVRFVYQTDKSKDYFEKIIKDEHEKGDLANPEIIQKAKEDLEAWEYKQDRLARAGRTAKEFISKLKVKSEEVPDTEGEYKANLETWTSNKKFPEKITHKFKVGENGTTKEYALDFPLDKEAKADLDEFYSSISEYNARQGIRYSDTAELLEERIWAKNGSKIAAKMVETALADQRKELEAKIHNPSTKKESTKSETPEKSEADKVAGEMFSHIKTQK